jgi:hypothetical protein
MTNPEPSSRLNFDQIQASKPARLQRQAVRDAYAALSGLETTEVSQSTTSNLLTPQANRPNRFSACDSVGDLLARIAADHTAK